MKSSLARAYGESTGYLFEFNPVLGYDFSYQGEDVDTYVPLYDPKTNDKAPQYEKLIAMIRTVNQASDADFQASAGAYVDLDGLMALLAAQNYMGDEDGVLSDVFTMNNFYLYRAANGQQFRFIPWDEDFSMIWSGRLVEQNLDKTVISRRAYAVPALRQTYLDSLMQTSTVAGAEDGWLQQEIERVYALIAPDARLDPHKQCIRGGSLTDCDADDFELQVDEVRKFAADRYNNVRSQLLAIPNHSATLMADGGIVNAATSKDGLAPGSLASIYGSSMAGTGEPASTFPLPTILSNTQVLVNGVAAPLLFASPLQINFQVPWATQAGDALIELSVAGAKKDAQRVPVQATAPGIFAATHANFVGVNGANPAKAGETLVLFATGLGPVSLSVADGQPAPLDQLSFTRQTVTATVDGLEAAVAFAGLAPGTAGVYQVNVVLPDSLNQNSASMANIALHVGGTDSPDFAVPKQ
ncbi:MAG: CotH kinase family protein [Acidobacteriota bacterium]